MTDSYGITSDDIYERTLQNIAPLPSQIAYMNQLSSILSFHLKRDRLIEQGFPPDTLPYQSVVIVAPTGQGKTYILRQMAKSLNLHSIVIDASTLAKEGWKGTGLGARLLAAKNTAKDEETFARSLLFLDEIDKLRFYGSEHDQGNPMENLLQLFDGAGIITAEGSGREAVNIDVSRFTIIFAGAFEGLHTIIEKRIKPKAMIGFTKDEEQQSLSKAELLKLATIEDLAEYGMMPELLGRIGSILSIDLMGMEDYRQLLTAENGSVRWKYQNYLKTLYGVDFEITEDGVCTIAEKCIDSMTGARAVNPLINDLMRDALATVECDTAINKVLLDAEERECIIRYGYDPRAYTAFTPKDDSISPYFLKAKNISELAERLCQIYQKTKWDHVTLRELETFLHCSLYFLRYHSDPWDFCFASLEKMVQLMGVDEGESVSTFDILITRVIEDTDKTNPDDMLVAFYQRFKECYLPRTAYRLTMALNQIMDFIVKEHHSSLVRFEIENC